MPAKARNRKSGRVFVISAPSGTGKTTLVNKLLDDMPGIIRSVSVTTRKKRRGEEEGRDYYFITKDAFKRLKEDNGLLEWAEVFGNFYGTPAKRVKEGIAKGKNVLLEIDVQGAMQVKKKIKSAVFIFIMPPSHKALEERLNARSTENGAQIKKRLSLAEHEMRFADKYDHIVINDDIERAVSELEGIILKKTKEVI